uniref:arsenite-transporting ATPase n=1 Tax=Magnetospirillum gryphiswaldense TaxID=55518 RepID=A4TZZ9_9PROT|nr:anion-transporting ATPase family protein [Magnetospirillum gryphiswaldense MSR-1]
MNALPIIATRHAFFTGKGGVGKTSLSCACGLALAEAGKRVLIVSTDPASNLDEVLGTQLTGVPTAIAGAPGLFALNIDPEAAARDYKERMVGPYRGILPTAAIASMEEQFSGACTVEIAAFDEFAKLLGDASATSAFDHVIFDTAPTGHTLRLLTLPSAWTEFIASSTGGASCLGPLAGLEKQKALYAATVAQLSDAASTTIILVSRPEKSALREAERTRGELAELGVSNLRLAVNGIFTAAQAGDAIADAMTARAAQSLAAMPPALAALPRHEIGYVAKGTVGLDSLRALGHPLPPAAAPLNAACPDLAARPQRPDRRDRCHRPRHHHDHGQGRRRQDQHRRRHRHRPGPGRPRRHLVDHRPRRPCGGSGGGQHPRPERHPHRPGSGSRPLSRRGTGQGRCRSGYRRSRHAGRGSTLALHRGNRRLPRLRPHRRSGPRPLRRA